MPGAGLHTGKAFAATMPALVSTVRVGTLPARAMLVLGGFLLVQPGRRCGFVIFYAALPCSFVFLRHENSFHEGWEMTSPAETHGVMLRRSFAAPFRYGLEALWK
jgi:hypothetical protein